MTKETMFEPFQKIARLNREIVITEKIDGTNAQIRIVEDPLAIGALATVNGLAIYAGSRNRFLSQTDDNFGFAKWAQEHAENLSDLGPGTHYGEWWGSGIQRRYGINEKRFSLFNVHRWGDDRPACCHVVPVLYRGKNSTHIVEKTVENLRVNGSVAAPGFMKPEGVIVYHTASNHLYKVTLEKDEIPKALQRTP